MLKNKRIVFVLVILVVIFTLNLKSYAITLPWFSISSNNYSDRDKMNLDEKNEVEVDKTLQLYGMIIYGNDLYDPEYPDSMGRYVQEANLSGITWTSSDTSIATVDKTGKVTGISEGKVTITAKYNEENATYEVNVKPKSEAEHTGIGFVRSIPEQAKILNKEYGFSLNLYNIPDTEKGNIKVTIDNENIAKLTGIDLCNWEDGSGKGRIIANAKLLALGETKITATLSYNGKTYSDSYDFDVVNSMYTLSLSAKEYTNLPSSLEIEEKIQLTAMFEVYGGSLRPEDVTSKGVTWTSSDEKIVKVDSKGLVIAIGEGTATITAKYKAGDETVTATYNLKITDSTKSPVNSGTTSNPSSTDSPSTKSDPTIAKTILPQTGENATIMIIGIVIVIAISMIMYKNYKDIK